MAITPEQARAELARRKAMAAQPAVAQPTAPTAPKITPEAARAELARRRAAAQQAPTAAPEQPKGFVDSAVQGLKNTAYEFVTPINMMPKEYIESTTPSLKEAAQSARERPTEMIAGTVGPAITVTGAALGGLPGGAAGLGIASGLQRGAQELDKKLYDITGGVVGNKRPAQPELLNDLRIVGEQILGVAIPVVGGKALGALRGAKISQLESKLATLEPKAAGNPAALAQINALKGQLAKAKVSGAEAAKKLGDEQVFSYNGIRFDDAAKAIKGDNWDAKTFAGSLTAGKASDFGSDVRVLSPISGKLNKGNAEKLMSIVKEDNKAYSQALLPDTNAYKDLATVKKQLDTQLEANKRAMQISQSRVTPQVFAPPLANTPITGSSLIKALSGDKTIAEMASIGAGPKLAAIRAAIPSGKPLTTKELAKVMETVQAQFVSKEDDKARAVFYKTVFPELKKVFENAAAQSTGPATKQYANAVINYFDNRFGLADVGGDFAKTILNNKPAEAIRMLSNREDFSAAKNVFDKYGGEGKFGDYVRLLISDASKDGQGQPQAHLLNQVLKDINIDAPEIARELGTDYIKKLKALQVVLNAEAIDGTKAQLVALMRGNNANKAKDLADSAKDLALNTLAYNPLGAGAAQANIGRAAFAQSFQPSLEAATVGRTATSQFAEGIAKPAQALISGAGVQTGIPATLGYTSMEERRKAAEAKLRELDATAKGVSSTTPMNGQGGPEYELAPSMTGGKPDELGALIDSLMGNQEPDVGSVKGDPLDRLITELQNQEDLTNLIKQAMLEEEPKVKKVLSTKNEEGFRSRVYKDTVGKRTVGIGFNMDAAGARKRWQAAGVKTPFDDVLAGKKIISKAEAEALFNYDKKNAIKAASKLVKNFSELGEHRQAALADMVYQLGEAGAMAFARTRKLIEEGKFAEAAQAMLASRNAKQTPARVKRRAYMLQHDVSLKEANDALIKLKQISSRESIG